MALKLFAGLCSLNIFKLRFPSVIPIATVILVQESVILSYAIVCLHPSMLLNNDKICRAISESKIGVCEKTAGLYGVGNFSDLDSACSKVLVPVKIFQIQDIRQNENRFLGTFRGHNTQPISIKGYTTTA